MKKDLKEDRDNIERIKQHKLYMRAHQRVMKAHHRAMKEQDKYLENQGTALEKANHKNYMTFLKHMIKHHILRDKDYKKN